MLMQQQNPPSWEVTRITRPFQWVDMDKAWIGDLVRGLHYDFSCLALYLFMSLHSEFSAFAPMKPKISSRNIISSSKQRSQDLMNSTVSDGQTYNLHQGHKHNSGNKGQSSLIVGDRVNVQPTSGQHQTIQEAVMTWDTPHLRPNRLLCRVYYTRGSSAISWRPLKVCAWWKQKRGCTT